MSTPTNPPPAGFFMREGWRMTTLEPSAVQAKTELVIGGTLVTTPGWVLIFHDISLIASTIAAVCGMIVGLHAVYKLAKQRRSRR